MTFCYQPWNGLEISNNGRLRPCCKYTPEEDPLFEQINIKDENAIEQFQNSKYIKNLQNSFLQGEKPNACVRCWKDEDAGYQSHRQIHNTRWKEEFDRYEFESQQINLINIPIGNLCNLKCRICSPDASSKWISEWKNIYGETFEKNDWANNPTVWKDLIKHSKNLLEIHIHGGEPFLLDDDIHSQYLESLIQNGVANKVRIHYNTNCTTQPSKNLRTLWKKFKFIDVQPSIDDIGKRFEYNRKGADWKMVEENLQNYKAMIDDNFQLSISCTVSIFTIVYLDEIFEYYLKNNLPKPWLGRLHSPTHYQCSVLPLVSKQKLQQKYQNSKIGDIRSVAEWLDEDNSHLIEKFWQVTRLHDQYRNEKIEQVFPELVDLLG